MRVDHMPRAGCSLLGDAVPTSWPDVSGGIEDVQATDAGPQALTDVRAVVVDTRSERRRLTRHLLESSVPPLEIAEADSRAAAIDLVHRFHPDLVVLEIQMPLEEGLDTIAALRLISPGPRIVVCSFHRDASTIQGAVDRGADAYLIKPVSSADLRTALGPLPGEPALRHRGPKERSNMRPERIAVRESSR
jgi:two-component system, chemotaxis family, chemotaxis protein CheY